MGLTGSTFYVLTLNFIRKSINFHSLSLTFARLVASHKNETKICPSAHLNVKENPFSHRQKHADDPLFNHFVPMLKAKCQMPRFNFIPQTTAKCSSHASFSGFMPFVTYSCDRRSRPFL